MSGQLSYTYHTPKGVPGGLLDINAYSIDSRINEEEKPGVMMNGMGVVQGTVPGTNVLLPAAGATVGKFEGVVMTGFTNQRDMDGETLLAPLQTVGILRWGRAWVRVAPDLTPAYGDALYLITAAGATRGFFTNEPSGNLAVKGSFLGGLGTGDIAPVVIYNQKSE